MEEIKTREDYEKVEAFRKLIRATMAALAGASMPAQLSRAVDEHLPAWEKRDADFAEILKGLKAQSWSMETRHIRDACSKVNAHLGKNLADLDAMLPD